MPGFEGNAPTLRAGGVRVIIAVGAALTVASVAAPWAVGAPIPTALDLAVPVTLLGVAVSTAGWRWPAIALAGAAGFWSATALSGCLPSWLEPVVERLGVWPHAAVVIAVLCLPFGALGGFRNSLAVVAAAVALLGSLGVGVPVLASFGLVLIGGAVSWWRRRAADPIRWALLLQLALGLGWVAVDVVAGHVPVRLVADLVDVWMVISAVAVAAFGWHARKPAGGTIVDELARRVGAVLGTGPVSVHFATPTGWVDVTGLATTPEGRGQPVAVDGRTIALVSATAPLPPSLGRVLARDLAPLAAIAALNCRRRQLKSEIAASRRRIADAAEKERHRTQEALTGTVLARLDRIESCLSGDGLDRGRLDQLREQLDGLVAGLDPLRGRTLGEALRALAGGHAIEVQPGLDAPPDVARAAWWIAGEAIANARKHAPGSRIFLGASRVGCSLHLRVSDDGPGGADAGGRGLLGAADRAAIVGGMLTVRSGASGTVIEAALPLTGATGSPLAGSRASADPAPPSPSLPSVL